MDRFRVIANHLIVPSTCNSGQIDGKAPVLLLVGVGPGISSSVAKLFAKEGFTVVVSRRDATKLNGTVTELQNAVPGGTFIGYPVDARIESQIIELFDKAETHGKLEVVVFNIGANVPSPILDETARKFRKIWEMACFSGFLVGREAARRFTNKQGKKTIIFTGATASLRGRANFSAFGSAKAALRSVAQSMAKELGPSGIHVCHVIIDGVVDTPPTRQFFGFTDKKKDEFIQPEEVAGTYLHLHKQEPSAWTFEVDVRPYNETWN